MGTSYFSADVTIRVNDLCRIYGINIEENELTYIMNNKNVFYFEKNICNLLDKCCDKSRHSEKEIINKTFAEILFYINENFTNNEISLDNVAEKFCMSSSLLSLKFKENTGDNYKDYIIRKRIELAKTLLENQETSVGEICDKVGYVNVSHFIKNFKKITGFTPAAYRRQTTGNRNLDISP